VALTRVSPSLFATSNNITSVTVGGSANTISLTFDASGVITSASNNAVSVANTAITGNIISSQITSVANTQISGNIISSQITSIGGSQITANTIANSAIQTGAVENYMNATGLSFGMRNRIINGAMVIDQRNAGASVTASTSAPYSVDRWQIYSSPSSKFTVQQTPSATETGYATRVGAGFTNYLGCTSSSAYTVTSSDLFFVQQPIEAFNTSDLAFGTANAKTITLSFWAYSSLTGTFGGALQNYAINRSYPFSYTISSANTWTQISVTITGDTSGSWSSGSNTGSIIVLFSLGMGSTRSGTANAWVAGDYRSVTGATSVVGTNGATFYITGVQLEKGSTATSFDYRPYGTELQLCQRYYENSFEVGTAVANGQNATAVLIYSLNGSADRSQGIFFKVQKRALSTFNLYSPNISGQTAGQWMVYAGSWSNGSSTTISDNGYQYFHIQTTFAATQNYTYLTSGNWTASAEL